MDLSQAINQPLAVVLILVVVFAAFMMGIDKLGYFIRSLTKKTPMDKMAGSYELMVKTVENVAENMHENTEALKLLNQQMKHHEEMAQVRHQQLLREMERK